MRKSLILLALAMIGATLNARDVAAQENPFRRAFDGVKRLLAPNFRPDAPQARAIDRPFEVMEGDVILKIGNAGQSWSPAQAAGPPNTPGAGDIETAWASATPDGQDEWLELTYKKAIVPHRVVIHETYNPGAVNRITVFAAEDDDVNDEVNEEVNDEEVNDEEVNDEEVNDEDPKEQEVWKGKDPTGVGEQRGISRIDVKTKIKTKKIRIYINSTKVAGWNEIDAVGIVDEVGELQWAENATASSTFGGGGVLGGAMIGGGFGRAVAVPAMDLALGDGDARNAVIDPDFNRLLKDQELQMAKLLRQLKEARTKTKTLEEDLTKQVEELNKLRAELKALKESKKP